MQKIIVKKVAGSNIYDEFGKRHISINNSAVHIGDALYSDNSCIFGRDNTARKSVWTHKKSAGAYLLYCIPQKYERYISPQYYQNSATYYGDIVSIDFYLDANFKLCENTDNDNFIMTVTPSLYNTYNSLNKDYAGTDITLDRVVAVIDDTAVIQSGVYKHHTQNVTIKDCEYLIDDEITTFDETITTIRDTSYTPASRDYIYLSQYTDENNNIFGDDSCKYDLDTINNIVLTAGNETLELSKVFDEAIKATLDAMKNMQKNNSELDVFPSLEIRPQPTPSIEYVGVCDKRGTRIDSRPDEQINNIYVSEVSLNPLSCTICIEIAGICYPFLQHKIYDNSDAVEWVPLSVVRKMQYRVSNDAITLIADNMSAHYLSHEMYCETTTELDGYYNISNGKCKFVRNTVYANNRAYAVKCVQLGTHDSSYLDYKVVSDYYTIQIDDYIYFDSEQNAIVNSNGDTLISDIDYEVNIGISHTKDVTILLLDCNAYMCKNGQILKHIDLHTLNKDFDGWSICNLNLAMCKDIATIEREMKDENGDYA